ncbi:MULTISPECIES: hypothetical protein [unclassified Streptomyces]|uniref:hypothetical protein n=1 Tax=unclassified Streptomyces TaxID=2593676 RepID=UPI000366D77A|nr:MULTISPECIES: hypothetical protein [unclassified Streptomyces]MYT30485.1 hypothetical protein [Streptomyces sp. SID8354]
MRYATINKDDDVLHRQDLGTTRALCGEDAPYDVDADEAAFGLIAGTRFTCGPCDMAAAHRAPVNYGFRAADGANDDVRAAVRVLAIAGFEPARDPDEFRTTARGFLVESIAPGSVDVSRLLNGVGANGEGAETMLNAYIRTFKIMGWETSVIFEDDGVSCFVAYRPADGEEVTSVTDDQPHNHPH